MSNFYKKDHTFTYADNCTVKGDAMGNVKTIKSSEIEAAEEEYLIDERLYIASCNNTMDLNEYLNYYSLLINTVQKASYGIEGTPGRFIALLDAGYVPVYAPPTFLVVQELMDVIISRLEADKIRYYRESQHRINGPTCNASNQDIWASKMDICERLGIQLNQFNMLKYLKEDLFK